MRYKNQPWFLNGKNHDRTAIALAGMAERTDKGTYADVLRQMVQLMAQRQMDMDVESVWDAGYNEKSAERLNSRNGFFGTTS